MSEVDSIANKSSQPPHCKIQKTYHDQFIDAQQYKMH